MAKPGWYEDPEGGSISRWYDGESWTPKTEPLAPDSTNVARVRYYYSVSMVDNITRVDAHMREWSDSGWELVNGTSERVVSWWFLFLFGYRTRYVMYWRRIDS